jgi:hypothetical protein
MKTLEEVERQIELTSAKHKEVRGIWDNVSGTTIGGNPVEERRCASELYRLSTERAILEGTAGDNNWTRAVRYCMIHNC